MTIDFKNNKLSELIEGQLPSFLQEEGPKFIKFVEKYYEWLETSKLEVSVNGELNLDFKKYAYDILAKRSIENPLEDDGYQTVKHVYANLLNSYHCNRKIQTAENHFSIHDWYQHSSTLTYLCL